MFLLPIPKPQAPLILHSFSFQITSLSLPFFVRDRASFASCNLASSPSHSPFWVPTLPSFDLYDSSTTAAYSRHDLGWEKPPQELLLVYSPRINPSSKIYRISSYMH
uniref:Uncharacterized protein n=1 Tax=Lotus japonicus TaxID=34305 RepID=I3SNH9_LOTJA|nr:unknown [Lotus japonicus]